MFGFKIKLEEDKIKLKDKLIVDAGELEKLINIDKGWKLYVEKIQTRIKQCRLYKANTKLAFADEQTKRRVEFLEYQADILEWAITMPADFINRVNKPREEDAKSLS